jgi:peptide/nickel transport system ATP-binding protein
MNTALLQVENLRTVFNAGKSVIRAVDGISFDVRRNETFALLGESGCGKSMTALSIMRLLPTAGRIVSGSILLEGQDLLSLPEVAMRTVRGKRIAMIFQEPMTSLNPVLTVGQQIAETLYQHTPLRGRAADDRVMELLKEVGIPDPVRRAREYPFQLSGGMKQRAMIAIALACEPDLLIADEPTTALDVTIQAQVLELLRRLQQRRGMAILLITHDLGVVSEMAHRVAVMYAGEIVELAEREQFFRAPRHPYTKKLFASLPGGVRRGKALEVIKGTVPDLGLVFPGCRFVERCDVAQDVCRETPPAWAQTAPGQGVRCHFGQADPFSAGDAPAQGGAEEKCGAASEPLLKVENLKIYFPIRKGVFKRTVGHVKAVDGVSLEIGTGRTLALVGESGCGKTTVGKGVLQLIRPDAGSVLFRGADLTRLRGGDLRSRRNEFQIVFQDPYSSLDPRMRIADILEEGMISLNAGSTGGERLARIDRLLEQVGLSPATKYRYPHEFSGGQRQRIAIARALAVNPSLMVCDEPTSALDVSVQAQILNLLKHLQDSLNLAYLFITHNLSVVEYFAHEVAVMYLGRIVEWGKTEEVMCHPRHPYTQALLSAVPVIEAWPEGEGKREVIRLGGDIPSPANPPAGCHFHPRCPHAMPVCRSRYPEAAAFSDSHWACCHLYLPVSG